MNTLSIELLGPEFVLLLAASWAVVLVIALAMAGIYRRFIHRTRIAALVADGSRTL